MKRDAARFSAEPGPRRRAETRGVAALLFGSLAAPLAGLITQPLLAQGLGVEHRGAVAAAIAPITFGGSVLTLGLDIAITYFIASRPGRIYPIVVRATGIAIGVGVVATWGLFALAPALSGGSAVALQLIRLAAWTLAPYLIVIMLRGVAAGLGLWRLIAAESVLSAGLRLGALAVLLATHSMTALNATLASSWGLVAGGVVYAMIPAARRRLGPTSVGALDHRGYLSYAFRLWGGLAAATSLSSVDQLLMTSLASSYQLGLYAVAVAVAQVPAFVILGTIQRVVQTHEAAEANDEWLGQTARVCWLALIAVSILIAALTPLVIPWLFGAGFGPAVPQIWILLLSSVLAAPGQIAGSALIGRGRPGTRTWITVVGAVVNIGLVILVVPHFGGIGAAWATVAGMLVFGILGVLMVKRFYGISIRQFYSVHRDDLILGLRLVGQTIRRQ